MIHILPQISANSSQGNLKFQKSLLWLVSFDCESCQINNVSFSPYQNWFVNRRYKLRKNSEFSHEHFKHHAVNPICE